MPRFADRRRTAFVSFAGPDRPVAERLRADLGERGVRAFVDDRDVPPGADVVLAISRRLERSDFYVLLWSRAAVDRPWVDAEWTAALARDIGRHRAFLFVLRLDSTPLPALLAARKYLDAADWDTAVTRLVAAWDADLALDVPVVPPPAPGPGAGQRVTLYVRNRALKVAHLVSTAPDTTGAELLDQLRAELVLPERESRFAGQVGIRFHYQLLRAGEPMPDKPLLGLGVDDGDVVDLEVRVEPFGPDGAQEGWVMRPAGESRRKLPPALERAAFRHLAP